MADRPRKYGTSREYGMRRLAQDAPEWHARVLTGEMSVHQAMVAAGLRVPRATVLFTSPEQIVGVLARNCSPEVLAQVATGLRDLTREAVRHDR